MTKAEMTEIVATIAGLDRKYAEAALDELWRSIAYEAVAGNRVTLPHLGTLQALPTPAKQGRNPRTGEPVALPAGRRIRFRAGKSLKDRLAADARAQAAE